MKKLLFISNGTKPTEEQLMSKEKIKLGNISKPSVEAAQSMNYEVYIGINREHAKEIDCDYDVKFYNASIYRSLIDIKSNFKAIRNLNKLLKEQNFDVLHCNTPIGGILGRLCGRYNRVPKIIYTVHGFHFYDGAPILNRTIFKWAEIFMARYTDVIITMNEEDYQSAKKLKLRENGNVYKISGAGIDTAYYDMKELNRNELRVKLGFSQDDILLISLGDLISRKNYSSSIRAISNLNNPKVKLLICGNGPELDNLIKLAESLGVKEQVYFLGFRKDIRELLNISDIFLFTTYQEGLPRSMMEAMSAGLPCIVSRIRGNVDLLDENKGGYLIDPNNYKEIAIYINKLIKDKDERNKFGLYNKEKIKQYDIKVVKDEIKKIYNLELI